MPADPERRTIAVGLRERFVAGQGVHVIVVGNEKGGSGKSTTAFHLAIYLLYQGFAVASIDVDSRQQTLTHYVRNRRDWAQDARPQAAAHDALPPAAGAQ